MNSMCKIISPNRIIEEHWKSINENASSFAKWGLFILGPIIAAVLLSVILKKNVTYQLIAILIPSYSIFAGLLLNAVFLVFDIVTKMESKESNDKKTLVRELYFNSLYTIFVAIVTILILFLIVVISPWNLPPILLGFYWISFDITNDIVSTIVYTLILHFVVNLMLVVKRLQSLLTHEIS